ncbi:carbohydrate binding domain-containing protein [Paenibacillus contaminans]|uniref:CBM-cenC domain-containing protein n=1 Tax=Paenibacillus contaminans TaxID=450362 RepID=A0A329MJT3_9BACL|nr:carbohydrate binding domain-containing protein [Paenibacillus contaminans]RAV18993.1 hypothetical protein DQG23_22875 [Paenibacillus contaminans]
MSQSSSEKKSQAFPLRILVTVSFFILLLWNVIGIAQADAQNIGDELLTNGGFEQLQDGAPIRWNATGGWTNPEISLSNDAAYTGSNGIVIQTAQNTKPWIMQIVPYEEGATYEISTWLKAVGVQGAGVGFKLEYYRGQDTSSPNHLTEYDKTLSIANDVLTGDWQKISMQVSAPPEAGNVKIYLRLYGTGTVYLDDASFVLKQHMPMIELKTDELIYYTGVTEGHVSAVFRSPEIPLFNKQAEVRIYRESTGVTMATYSMDDASYPMTFVFDPSMMIKNEPYRVQVKLSDDSNVLLESAEETIYRFDRPTMLQEDGTLTVNGAPFFPVAAYHAGLSDYPYLAQSGVNAVQGVATNNADVQQAALDTAQQNGLKVMVPLYYNMQVQENAATTQQFVSRFKDHPAVLAWMIMDEPMLNGKTKEELIDAYRIIRTIDEKHPIYMVEAPLLWAYDTTAKIADIFATDSYPLPNNPISLVGEHTVLGKQAAGESKPVWTVLQAMYNQNHPYLPTIDEVRNMAYQSLLSGAQGLAYYSFNEQSFQLRNSALWSGLVGFKEELGLLGRLVSSAERIGEGQEEDSRWTLWKDGDILYAAAVNTSGEIRQVTVPIGATGYTAELLYGDSQSSLDEQGGVLNFRLGPKQAQLYRIIPFRTMVGQAIESATILKALSENPKWNKKVQRLSTKLTAVRNELETAQPNMADVIKDAVRTIRIVDRLTNRAGHETDEELKQEMLSELERIKGNVMPIVGSELLIDVTLSENQIIGQSQTNELTVFLQNEGQKNMSNMRLSLAFPAAFALEPAVDSISLLQNGQTAEKVFPFQIAATAAEGRYPLAVKIDYDYKGIPVTVMRSVYYPYINLIRAEVKPEAIVTNKGGSFPFGITIANNVSREMQISLEAGQLPSGIIMQLPDPFLLPGNGQTTVTGSVYLPPGAAEGNYAPSIMIGADGNHVQSVPLSISYDHNLLQNPGFEQAAGGTPDGWNMRKGSWSAGEAHSGQYAVALTPDSGNAFNVINSSGFIPVEGGAKYVLRGWVKNESTTGLVQIGLRQIKEDKTASVSYTWKTINQNAEWTFYELEVTPQAAAKYLQVYLSVDTNTNGLAWFDDLDVREGKSNAENRH